VLDSQNCSYQSVLWRAMFQVRDSDSVADPDPGTGMGESQHPDPGSGMNNPDHIFYSLETIFLLFWGIKKL
jgi:hypothetical protein